MMRLLEEMDTTLYAGILFVCADTDVLSPKKMRDLASKKHTEDDWHIATIPRSR